MKARRLFFLTVTALLLVAAGSVHADKAKVYKWVDKDGVVHYGSSIPPEYASQASEQLNSQGEVIKTQEAQKTPQQLAAEAQAQQQAQQQAQAQAAAKVHDQVLLDTYTSVTDIERDRDSKLSAIDAQINVLNGALAGLQNSLAEYQSRTYELTGKGKPIPADLQKRIDDTQQQYVADQQQLQQERQHKQQVAQQFVDDIARYQVLTGATPAPAATSH
ncbi:MAG TPA: DUF4124 domain-containing protein [Gammaproteobacteria bacterium]|nr:DUF4124 domain-containing protein [Gammaproteobacteria bacterium]